MKVKLVIDLEDQFDDFLPKMEFNSICFEKNTIVMHITPDENCLDVFSNTKYRQEMFDYVRESIEMFGEMNDESELYFQYYELANLKNILNNSHLLEIDKIEFLGDFDVIKQYMDKFPEILNKNIVLTNSLNLDKSDLERVKRVFGYNDKIKVMIEGNEDPISILDFEKTLNLIDEVVNKVNKYTFTPFEASIYIYDLVRDRVYVKGSEKDEYFESRDLTKVLLGDKIVCLGFARLFETVANRLGINTKVFVLHPKKGNIGHARCLSYIKDNEYALDGLYFFDPSHGSKRDGYLNSYLFCARTKNQLEKFDGDRYDNDFELYFDDDLFIEFMQELEDITNVSEVFRKYSLSRFNYMQRLLNEPEIEKFFLKSVDELVEAFYNIKEKIGFPIEYDKFIKALYKVRKVQYYENPEKYAFDLNTLSTIVTNSKLPVVDTNYEKLLTVIFGDSKVVGATVAKERVEQYLKNNDLDKDMERVKLTRLLRTLEIIKAQNEIQNRSVIKKVK